MQITTVCDIISTALSVCSESTHPLSSVPPTITVPPGDTVVKEDGRVEFRCIAIGIPDPTIVWTLDETVVGTGPTLVVDAVSEDDEGVYVCGASNGNGEAASAAATLTIYGKRHHTSQVDTDLNSEFIITEHMNSFTP